MKQENRHEKATTVSVDVSVRDSINEEADRLGLSQRQMVAKLTETYKLTTEIQASHEEQDTGTLTVILENLEKVIKRDDRVVAFIKEQEKLFLSPILRSIQSTDAQLNKLIEILSNLE